MVQRMQHRSEETRARLLQAAIQLFSTKGYASASVDDICLAAGVSKGAFYHHFPSKQSVFIHLLDIWLAAIDANLESSRQATVPETLVAMTEMLPGILQSASGNLPMFLEFWLQASRDEAIWNEITAPYQRYQAFFSRLVEQGIQEGSFRPVDPQAAAQVIVSLAVGIFLQAVLAEGKTDWQKLAQQGMEILLKGITP